MIIQDYTTAEDRCQEKIPCKEKIPWYQSKWFEDLGVVFVLLAIFIGASYILTTFIK